MNLKVEKTTTDLRLIKKCHHCGTLLESCEEVKRCDQCQRSFLPLNYFHKVHAKNPNEYAELFSPVSELHEDDLIKGLYAIW